MTPNLDLRDFRHFSMTLNIITILLLVSCCHTQQLEPQQAVDCTDPTSAISPSCWDALAIPAWLSRFAGPNSICAKSSLTHLAGANSSWGACFILTIDSGPEGQTIASSMGLLNANITADALYQEALGITPVEDRPRYLYVLTALSHIRGLFLSWSNTISSDTIALESQISAILAALDPGNQTSFSGDDLYQAIFLGLPFFLANNGTGIPLGLGLEDISGLLYELVQDAIVPPSNVSSPTNMTSVISASALPSLLTNLTPTLVSGIQHPLQSITSSLDIFLNLTSHGTFSTPQPWSLPPNPAILTSPLTTYLVSSILAQTNWTVLALVGIDVAALSQNPTGILPPWVLNNCPTCTPPVNFGCTSYDSNSQCGRWWYSSDLNSSFTLIHTSNAANNDPTALIATIFNQGWTTGSLLFENAAICNEPPTLKNTISAMPQMERPASPLTDYMDSWFWKLMSVAPLAGTASVDIVVSEKFDAYIESQPGSVSHLGNTLVGFKGGKIDFSCVSQLGLRVGWDWSGVVAGDFS